MKYSSIIESLRKQAKFLMPRPLRDLIRGRPLATLQLISWTWHCAKGLPKVRSDGTLNSLLIIPPDTYSVMGSRGDDAMVSVVAQQARKRNPGCRLGIVSFNATPSEGAKRLKLETEPVWSGSGFSEYLKILEKYDAAVVIGADVMDGHYYSAGSALRYWLMADLAARIGIPSTVVGFSFEHPEPILRKALNGLSPDVRICVRDEVSLACFRSFCNAQATLTSDIAFLLDPAEDGGALVRARNWIDAQRNEGYQICAVNLRPMHYVQAGAELEIDLSGSLAAALVEVAENARVAYMLLPHDFRAKGQSDLDMLTATFKVLKDNGCRVFFQKEEVNAVELKSIVGLADILLTGRMHLGIAAISQGIPVISISFQEKFKGFYKLFGLTAKFLLSPLDAQESQSIANMLRRGLGELDELKKKIRLAAPSVRELSKKNFQNLK